MSAGIEIIQPFWQRLQHDMELRRKVLKDGRAALLECGVEIPAGTDIRVLENSENQMHLVFPAAPPQPGAELTSDEQQRVVGGAGGSYQLTIDPIRFTLDGVEGYLVATQPIEAYFFPLVFSGENLPGLVPIPGSGGGVPE